MKNLLLSIGLILLINPILLSQNVWILNNGDPDYQNPPFNDSLKVFQHDGTFLMAKGGFNITQTISGTRGIAASQDGQSCWVSSFVNDLLLKIDIQGNTVLEIPRGIGAIDIEQSGLIYALTSSGTIFGDSIIVLDEQGNFLIGEFYGGIDIAVDNENSSVWIVGADIKRLNLDLQHQFTIDPVEWSATSVDYASDGTAWIGEGLHSGVPGSKNRLLHIDLNGTILDSIDFTSRPMCVRVDRSDETVWIISGALYKYIPSQSQLDLIDNISGFTLSIDQSSDLIWVATYSDVRSYTKAGVLQTVLTNFDGNDQKYISTHKQTSTGIGENDDYLLTSFTLEQNYPNPFNPVTTIQYQLPEESHVQLTIINLLGEIVTTPVNQIQSSGNKIVHFDASDLASGVYFYRLSVGSHVETHKMILLK